MTSSVPGAISGAILRDASRLAVHARASLKIAQEVGGGR